ncbi:GNAT family protein [Pontibacter brevis]
MLTNDFSPTILATERLYLRELTPDMYNTLFRSYAEREIKAYLGLRSAAEFREAKRRYEQGTTTYYTTFKHFHLLHKENGQVIGRCDFHTWIRAHRRAEVGYTITSEEYKNQGLMTEALRAVLSYGFEKMSLYRVEALASPHNTPSLRLLKHHGFQKEGHLRSHYMIDTGLQDSLMFSLLLPEFEKLKASWVQHAAKDTKAPS